MYILGLFFQCFVFSLYEYVGRTLSFFSKNSSSLYFSITFIIATFRIKTGVYERQTLQTRRLSGSALIKKKIKFSSYIGKFRVEQLQSHIWLTASSYMGKYFCISSYIRKPFLIYVFATAPLWISLYMRKIWFSFLSVCRREGWCKLVSFVGLWGWVTSLTCLALKSTRARNEHCSWATKAHTAKKHARHC